MLNDIGHQGLFETNLAFLHGICSYVSNLSRSEFHTKIVFGHIILVLLHARDALNG